MTLRLFPRRAPQASTTRGLSTIDYWSDPKWRTAGGGVVALAPTVYACLRLISKRLSSMPLRVLDPDDQELPVPLWLRQPNEWTDTRVMIERATYCLLMHGAWTVLPQRDRAGRIASLQLPDPTLVDVAPLPISADAVSQRWVLFVNGQQYTNEHYYAPWFSTGSDPRGLSAISHARIVASINRGATNYLDGFFKRGVVTQFVLGVKDGASPDQLDEIRAAFKAKYAGPEASYAPLAVPADVTVTPISMSLKDAEFLGTAQWSDVQLANVFGVDATLLNIVQSGASLTYQNSLSREANLWRDALQPVAVIIENTLSSMLPKGQRVDIDQTRYLQGTVQDRATMAQLMSSMTIAGQHCYTVDEVRAVQGYAMRDDLPDTVTPPAVDDTDTDSDPAAVDD